MTKLHGARYGSGGQPLRSEEAEDEIAAWGLSHAIFMVH